jgi:hypothetical protein
MSGVDGFCISEHHRHKVEINYLIPTLLTVNDTKYVSFRLFIVRHDSFYSALFLRKFGNKIKC